MSGRGNQTQIQKQYINMGTCGGLFLAAAGGLGMAGGWDMLGGAPYIAFVGVTMLLACGIVAFFHNHDHSRRIIAGEEGSLKKLKFKRRAELVTALPMMVTASYVAYQLLVNKASASYMLSLHSIAGVVLMATCLAYVMVALVLAIADVYKMHKILMLQSKSFQYSGYSLSQLAPKISFVAAIGAITDGIITQNSMALTIGVSLVIGSFVIEMLASVYVAHQKLRGTAAYGTTAIMAGGTLVGGVMLSPSLVSGNASLTSPSALLLLVCASVMVLTGPISLWMSSGGKDVAKAAAKKIGGSEGGTSQVGQPLSYETEEPSKVEGETGSDSVKEAEQGHGSTA